VLDEVDTVLLLVEFEGALVDVVIAELDLDSVSVYVSVYVPVCTHVELSETSDQVVVTTPSDVSGKSPLLIRLSNIDSGSSVGQFGEDAGADVEYEDTSGDVLGGVSVLFV
jgi:hypothetical protein